MGTQMALKAQCSTEPLRGKVSSWAISVIMDAHVLWRAGLTVAVVAKV